MNPDILLVKKKIDLMGEDVREVEKKIRSMGTFVISIVDLDENINDPDNQYYRPFQDYIHDPLKVFEFEKELKL